MSILAWIEDQKRLKLLNAPKYVNPASDSSKGLWTRCDKCGVILYIKHLKENQRVCFGCSYHLQMSSQERVENLLDKDSWRPLDETVSPCDPLEFHDQKDYTDRLQEAQERTGLQDAIQTGSGMVNGIPIALGVMDFDFMGGSMGSVVGEKVTRLIEYATQEGLTLVLVCASGGARMQEGVFSLMQMAKISSALQVYQACANLLYISILTSPTTGGVTASFAMLGDIIFAEPKALVAFAGRRVIEQTLCEDLPEDFQTSEYMLHHGLLDLIVPRRFFRQALSESIRLYKNAPFKKPGRIPFGVQNPITFLVEERIRRRWAVGDAPVGDKLSRLWVESKRFRSQQSSLLRGAGGKDADGVSTPSPSGVTQNVFTPAQLEGKDSSSELTVLNRNGSTKTALSANAQEIVRPGAPSQSRENSKPFQDGIIKESEAQTGDINKQKDGVEASGSSEQAALLAMETPRAVPSQKQSVSTRFQPTTEVATSSLLDASVQNHDPISGSLDPLLQREAIDYRDILTSFQTMFNLFSKELVLPYASVYAKNTRLDEHKEGETVSGMKKRISLDSKAEQAPYERDFEDGNANLLHKFFTLSENKNLNQAERLHTRLRLSEDAGPQTQVENMSAGNISNGTNQSQSVKKEIQGVDQSSRPAALEITTTGIPTPTSGASSQAMEPLSVHRDVPPSSLGTSKELVGSPSVYVDFLNQSIELAATESVEWRAFYLHQKISQTTGFIEDLAQSLPDYPQNNNEIAFQNMIFYRSICRKLS